MAKRYPTLEEVLTEAGLTGIIKRAKEEQEREIAEGKERGIAEGKEKTARNLLAEGMPIEQVARLTELPTARVRALKKSKAS